MGSAAWISSCATPFGPGYVLEDQDIRVSFSEGAEPALAVNARYQLKNTGIRELHSLVVRLPGRRFNPDKLVVTWDGVSVPESPAGQSSHDVSISFPTPWQIAERHTLSVSYRIGSQPTEKAAVHLSSDALLLPAEGWTPELPQAHGPFGYGGVPPKKWDLLVEVPRDFLLHCSGKEVRAARNAPTMRRFTQSGTDLSPFVVAGRFREVEENLQGGQPITIWSRSPLAPADLRGAGDSLARVLGTFDSLFGARSKVKARLWIVECPEESPCGVPPGAAYTALLFGERRVPAAEMISIDTLLIDSRTFASQGEAIASPALAAAWLGYSQNPGFYEQQPPMSALPAFAAAEAREAVGGQPVRAEIIKRALLQVPEHAAKESNDDPVVVRAKSLLLFYALRDRVGSDDFQKAVQHMLLARKGRGFDVTDLISALDQESHQNVGPFVRKWIKQPGVPEDFRALYRN